ncbi:hypothetical protein [Nocardioides sp.]|uniref:hypothetical protein n=1 Tax=Nocardioides sp. TaxID=35761 RepID=UPI002ED9C78F
MARRSAVDRGDDSVVGREGRVTGTVGPGLVGEVILPIRGGSEAFNAYPYVGTDTFPIGTLVRVMEYAQPRIVYVSAAL